MRARKWKHRARTNSPPSSPSINNGPKGFGSRGLLLEGQKLMDGEGRVLSPTDGGMTVKDGPYVETKEVVGGFYLVEADSYEHVIELCQDHPHLTHFGSIEVRAIDSLGEGEGA